MDPDQKKDRRLTTFRLGGDPASDPAAARKIHTQAFAGGVYAQALGPVIREIFASFDLNASAIVYVEDMLSRMAPRDPMEEMLAVQALLAHIRAMNLTAQAGNASHPDHVKTINEYADKAGNSFRRLMLALAEYRRPPRAGDTFTAIRQANIAGQQLVMNSNARETETMTNEQGFRDGHQPEAAPPAIPTQPRGSRGAEGGGEPDEALGAVHRAEDAGG